MTKCLSHYHLCIMVCKYVLNEIQDKYSLCFCGLHTSTSFSVSNRPMNLTYSIITLLNISFVNRRCMKRTISMNRGLSLALQPSANYGLLVSRGFLTTHNDVPQSVVLLWTSDEQGMKSGNFAVWRYCLLSNMECYTKNHTKMLHCTAGLTLNLLTTTIVAPPSNASKWQMGFNSVFKGMHEKPTNTPIIHSVY